MKRFFLILLLLPSLGICSTIYSHAPSLEDFIQAANNIHRHNDSGVMIERDRRTYNVPAPSRHRYYPRPHRYPRYSYRGRYPDHYQEHSDNYLYDGHQHGHR